MVEIESANHRNGERNAELDTTVDILSDLVSRAKLLQAELETFQSHQKKTRREGTVEIAHFRSTVLSEVGALERLSKQPTSENTTHIARSSNLPFLERVWDQAKQSQELTALHKRIYYNSPVKRCVSWVEGVIVTCHSSIANSIVACVKDFTMSTSELIHKAVHPGTGKLL